MADILVDTNIIIDHLRGFRPATQYLLEKKKTDELWISLISLAEIYAGKRMEEKNVALRVRRFLTSFRTAYLSSKIAITAGEYARRINGMSLPDAFIAATAVTKGFALATRNVEHFKGVKTLRIEPPF
jgi:predicted nucleic acid-binding protein